MCRFNFRGGPRLETHGFLDHIFYETILGDSAICVNPNDDRFKDLIGMKAIVPIVDRHVPIISDEYVDIDYGTGCLKVTPAHDHNDKVLGEKHNLEFIDILNEDAS